MKRIHARATSGTFEGIGYLCYQEHVVLVAASDELDRHLLTPTFQLRVLCRLSGELVGVT